MDPIEVSVPEILRVVDSALDGEPPPDPRGAAQLIPLVYDRLRALAAKYLSREREGHTLQPTALVHEAFLQLVGQTRVGWRGRTHFCAVAAIAMRRILIEHHRDKNRQKRGGNWKRVTLSGVDVDAAAGPREWDFELLEQAIGKLQTMNARAAQIVELKFFGGLKEEEIAGALGFTTRTVERDWRFARAWLLNELSERGNAE